MGILRTSIFAVSLGEESERNYNDLPVFFRLFSTHNFAEGSLEIFRFLRCLDLTCHVDKAFVSLGVSELWLWFCFAWHMGKSSTECGTFPWASRRGHPINWIRHQWLHAAKI